MKTTAFQWLRNGFLPAALLATTPLSAQTLLFEEQFNGTNYTIGFSVPVSPQSPWLFYPGTNPAPRPSVVALADDKNGQRPASGNALHGTRTTGQGSHSGVYVSTGKLEADGWYQWSLNYKTNGGNNYVYLDTASTNVFAGFQISGTSLYYYTATEGSVGKYTQAGSPGNWVSVENDVWYDISFLVHVRTDNENNRFVDYTFTMTALGASDPLFSITLGDIGTTANFTNAIRMGLSPQNIADFSIADVSLYKVDPIPEPGSVLLLGTAGALFAGAALRRRQNRS